jgi:hypothetical protein
MMSACRISALAVLSLGLSACTGYSGLINSFAPEKQESVVTVGRGTAEPYARGASPFCVALPPPVREVYMVMPEEGGKAGTVAVTFIDGREQMLHGDYSAMSLAGEEAVAFTADREQMEKLFGGAVAALPPAPYSATLYFLLGKDELTPASEQEAGQVYANIVNRQAPEIRVIGHTDTVGSLASNDALSEQRAQKIRWRLIELGVAAANIQVQGLGERELLVPTPDNTKEPRNRCVVISVR